LSRKASPGTARFRHLLLRASFELRMAGDVARAEGMDPDLLEMVEGSKRHLRVCLSKLQAQADASRGPAVEPCRNGE
jgi:hypothetical protein